jgi:cell wall-associated NlpC family hydrolase
MLPPNMQKQVMITLGLALLLSGSGCSNRSSDRHAAHPTPAPAATSTPTSAPSVRSAQFLVANQSTASKVPVYKEAGGLVWVPLTEAAKSMNMELHLDHAGFAVGNTDPAFSGKMGDAQAQAGDQAVKLPQAPRYFGGKPYITTQALSALTGTAVKWNEPLSQVLITPIDDRAMSKQPADLVSPSPGTGSSGSMTNLAAKSVHKAELIRFAEQFQGTPYRFAAGPYESTHAFDCSSFMQYAYGHFGVDLPRASRSQAQVGQTVDAKDLQPGDLMFFYTPGRYADNRIVGHVGMYAGNGKIIQTYGSPGVTISDFNAYWKNRFLFAKRVA